VAGGATGERSIDRGDRPRGRPRPVHGVLLGAQARADVGARRAPRGAGAARARAAHRDRELHLSVRDMADVLGRSPTTVRHWLGRYGLESGPTRRRAAVAAADRDGIRELELPCERHGPTRHVRRADGFRCARCEVRRVVAWRRKVKRILVEEAGGACALCGYAECDAALQFHHVDPAQKSFALSREGVTRSLARAREEAAKCVLLCANCHARVEAGLAQLPLRSVDRPVYPA
jgi:hypothetical protein